MMNDKRIILLPIVFFHLVGAQQPQLGDIADRLWFLSIPAPRSSSTCPCLFGAGRPTSIRDDYTFVAGIGSYKLHTRAMPWNEARITCEEEGGHLAIINSVAEANAVTEIFKNAQAIVGSARPDSASIGFHDLFHEGQYITVHGQTLAKAGFTRWAGGQPDNAGGNENCGTLHKSGGLNDIDCTSKLGFICELPIH